MISKGQLEIEAIISIVLALGILLLVLAYTTQQKEEIKTIETLNKEKNQCELIASILSLTNSTDTKETTTLQAEFSTTITQNTVLVGNHYCSFLGTAEPASLAAGKILIKEQNGVGIIENA